MSPPVAADRFLFPRDELMNSIFAAGILIRAKEEVGKTQVLDGKTNN